MKISIDIDCTPDEARDFLGLPDVKALQGQFVEELSRRMSQGLAGMDLDSAIKAWMPGGLPGFEAMQMNFWAKMTGGTDTGGSDED